MAKFPVDILKMALDPLADSAEAIVRNISYVPADKAGALTRMADDVVDDWGWKGGKPGEITGGQYMDLYRKAQKETDAATSKMELKGMPEDELSDYYYDFLDKRMRDTNRDVMQQFSNNPRTAGIAQNDWNIVDIMHDFSKLEKADIPREFTGKLLLALYQKNIPQGFRSREDLLQAISNAMRGMYVKGDPDLTKQYRETFLSILPEWEGSIENLAIAARSFVD